MRLVRLPEFAAWFEGLPAKGKAQVDARLLRIQEHSHVGDAKYLGDGLAELRWRNGWRVYFSRLDFGKSETVLLILGGNKNVQEKDIKRARILLERYSKSST